ncbi:MAG TPA: toll/interleukin-1 receptor domain-containing protein, partial [Segetibacter sp.]
MANKTHLDFLMLGVNTWNNWRERNPGEKPDLSGVTLRTPYWITQLSRSDEERYSYEDLDKYVAQKKEREKWAKKIICGNNLKSTSYLGAHLKGINFRQADLREADLWGANLCEAELQAANLAGASLKFANLKNADLSGADLHSATLRAAGLSGAILSEANLKCSDLGSADLRKANLVGADLSGASLSRANLLEADLRRAVLSFSDLSAAELRAANFGETQINYAIFDNVDLSEVIKLATAHHLGPSTISVETLFLSKGNMPLSFLRGVGMPENLITYLPSLTEQALQFYSCFISYSHADKPFARHLHDSLQGKGIRCWLDEHEMLPGQKIYTEVDKGIRLSDKVLLC